MTEDLFFKFLLIGEDEGSLFLRRLIVEEGLGLPYQKITVQNPNFIPLKKGKKGMFFDTLLKDEQGRFIHLEMQRHFINKDFYARIFGYGCRVIVDELRKGEKYYNGNVVYQCVFVETKETCDSLTQTYRYTSEYGALYPIKQIITTFVYIKNIEKDLEKKELQDLTMFECLIYLFNYGLDSDIMKLDKKVVKIMENKQEEYDREYAKVLEERSIKDYEYFMKSIFKEGQELQVKNAQLKEVNHQLSEANNQLSEANDQLSETNEHLSEENAQLNQSNSQKLEIISNALYYLMENQHIGIEDALNVIGIPQKDRAYYLRRFKN